MNITASKIFSLWKESLELFRPKEFKLLMLATLGTMLRALKITAKYTLGAVLASSVFMLLLHLIPGFHLEPGNLGSFIFLVLFLLIAFQSTYFYMLSCRPSMERKDCKYFIKYLQHTPGFLVLVLLNYYFPLFGYVAICIAFFYFDSTPSIKSFFRSFLQGGLLSIALAPFMVIMLVAAAIILIASIVIFIFTPSFTAFLIMSALQIIAGFISLPLLSVLYTKMKHRHFDLFHPL